MGRRVSLMPWQLVSFGLLLMVQNLYATEPLSLQTESSTVPLNETPELQTIVTINKSEEDHKALCTLIASLAQALQKMNLEQQTTCHCKGVAEGVSPPTPSVDGGTTEPKPTQITVSNPSEDPEYKENSSTNKAPQTNSEQNNEDTPKSNNDSQEPAPAILELLQTSSEDSPKPTAPATPEHQQTSKEDSPEEIASATPEHQQTSKEDSPEEIASATYEPLQTSNEDSRKEEPVLKEMSPLVKIAPTPQQSANSDKGSVEKVHEILVPTSYGQEKQDALIAAVAQQLANTNNGHIEQVQRIDFDPSFFPENPQTVSGNIFNEDDLKMLSHQNSDVESGECCEETKVGFPQRVVELHSHNLVSPQNSLVNEKFKDLFSWWYVPQLLVHESTRTEYFPASYDLFKTHQNLSGLLPLGPGRDYNFSQDGSCRSNHIYSVCCNLSQEEIYPEYSGKPSKRFWKGGCFEDSVSRVKCDPFKTACRIHSVYAEESNDSGNSQVNTKLTKQICNCKTEDC